MGFLSAMTTMAFDAVEQAQLLFGDFTPVVALVLALVVVGIMLRNVSRFL